MPTAIIPLFIADRSLPHTAWYVISLWRMHDTLIATCIR